MKKFFSPLLVPLLVLSAIIGGAIAAREVTAQAHLVGQPAVGGVVVVRGANDPTAGAGIAAPRPALYVRTGTDQIYLKTGAGNTAWTQLAQSGGAASFSSVTATGDITSSGGNISATAGSLSAGTTVTAGTGITATTGNIVASSGAMTASGNVTGAQHVAVTDALGFVFSSDTDTGISRTSADNIFFVAGGGARAGATAAAFQLINNTLFQALGSYYDQGVITPTALAANTNDWNPTGFSGAREIRVSASVAVDLTGLVADSNGRAIWLTNVGANTITIKHDLTSTAANRFFCLGAADIALTQYKRVYLIYNTTLSRWMAS